MLLTYPKTLIIDNGKEFYGDTTKLMEKNDVIIQHGDTSQHRLQGIVERFNRTFAYRLFSYQYHKELEDPLKSNGEWVSRLQNVVSALNNEKARLTEMKPIDAIKETLVKQGFSQPFKNYKEKLLDVGTKVRYLYEPGELEGLQHGGERRKRSTDPIWSVDMYKIKDRYVRKLQPMLYYLDGGPKRSFIFEELQPIQALYSLAHKSENVYNLSDILIRDMTPGRTLRAQTKFCTLQAQAIAGLSICYREIPRISYNFV